jgi:hypothetical protein
MNFRELKRLVRQGNPVVHILSNQGDLYLVRIFSEGEQSLLTKKNSSRPLVFRGLPQCYEKLRDAGLRHGFVDQFMAFDQMINNEAGVVLPKDHRPVCF